MFTIKWKIALLAGVLATSTAAEPCDECMSSYFPGGDVVAIDQSEQFCQQIKDVLIPALEGCKATCGFPQSEIDSAKSFVDNSCTVIDVEDDCPKCIQAVSSNCATYLQQYESNSLSKQGFCANTQFALDRLTATCFTLCGSEMTDEITQAGNAIVAAANAGDTCDVSVSAGSTVGTNCQTCMKNFVPVAQDLFLLSVDRCHVIVNDVIPALDKCKDKCDYSNSEVTAIKDFGDACKATETSECDTCINVIRDYSLEIIESYQGGNLSKYSYCAIAQQSLNKLTTQCYSKCDNKLVDRIKNLGDIILRNANVDNTCTVAMAKGGEQIDNGSTGGGGATDSVQCNNCIEVEKDSLIASIRAFDDGTLPKAGFCTAVKNNILQLRSTCAQSCGDRTTRLDNIVRLSIQFGNGRADCGLTDPGTQPPSGTTPPTNVGGGGGNSECFVCVENEKDTLVKLTNEVQSGGISTAAYCLGVENVLTSLTTTCKAKCDNKITPRIKNIARIAIMFARSNGDCIFKPEDYGLGSTVEEPNPRECYTCVSKVKSTLVRQTVKLDNGEINKELYCSRMQDALNTLFAECAVTCGKITPRVKNIGRSLLLFAKNRGCGDLKPVNTQVGSEEFSTSSASLLFETEVDSDIFLLANVGIKDSTGLSGLEMSQMMSMMYGTDLGACETADGFSPELNTCLEAVPSLSEATSCAAATSAVKEVEKCVNQCVAVSCSEEAGVALSEIASSNLVSRKVEGGETCKVNHGCGSDATWIAVGSVGGVAAAVAAAVVIRRHKSSSLGSLDNSRALHHSTNLQKVNSNNPGFEAPFGSRYEDL